MTAIQPTADQPPLQVMLPLRLTEGIVVRRIMLNGAQAIETNVPPLRHAGRTGFDFGNDGPGASDLALACVHGILERMDYVGPVQKAWDGSRVYRLALDLQTPFRERFIESAQGDELLITWTKALSWMRGILLERLKSDGITPAALLAAWRRSASELPDPLPSTDLDLAEMTQQLRDDLANLAGDASVLAQFLGMIA